MCGGFISVGDTVSVPETGGGVCLSCCVTLGYVHLECVNINVVFMFFPATRDGESWTSTLSFVTKENIHSIGFYLVEYSFYF